MDPMDTTYASLSAPLPSPSSSQPSQYFTQQHQNHQQNPRQQSSTSVPRSPPRSQPLSFPKLPVQSQQSTNRPSQMRPGQDHDPYVLNKEKDFCLIAEAAKRAQMAVLMRDMGDLGVTSR